MAAFDTALTPVAVTPANTSNTTLDPDNDADASVMVDVCNIGTGTVVVKVGITPSGGSVHWKVFEFSIPVAESLLGVGPLILQTGDVVTVQTDTADDATFSLTGVESSA